MWSPNSEWFQFVPSNPWVSVNWRKPEDVKVHLPPVFARMGIGFHPVGAKRIDPAKNEVELGDGRTIAYDYLVIATGPKLAFDEIEGLGPQANTRSICHDGRRRRSSARLGSVLQELPARWSSARPRAPRASARPTNTR